MQQEPDSKNKESNENNEKVQRDQDEGLVNRNVTQPKRVDDNPGSEPAPPATKRPADRPF